MATGLIIGMLTLLFGLIILAFPKALRLLVGGYFIIVGLIQIVSAVA
ncbi:MAG: DUF3096 domain-containing protein [Candidatus Woesearchaeota archaeon]